MSKTHTKTAPWRLAQTGTTLGPFEDEIRLYTNGELFAFTRTDTSGWTDRPNVCQLYLSLADFVSTYPDLEFQDTEENRRLLLESLDKATEAVTADPDGKTFLDILRELLPVIGADDEE
jgi:hypothetical protein